MGVLKADVSRRTSTEHSTSRPNNHCGTQTQALHPLNPEPLNEKIQDKHSEKVLPTSVNPRLLDRIGYSWSSTTRINCNSTQPKADNSCRFIFFVAECISPKTRTLSVLSGKLDIIPKKRQVHSFSYEVLSGSL